MWDKTWNAISKVVKRKLKRDVLENRRDILMHPLKFPLLLTLFTSYSADICSEKMMNKLIKLFTDFPHPKMIEQNFWVTLWNGRDAMMKLSDYKTYVNVVDLDYLDMYNKIIETAINREINLANICSYVFIGDILSLTNVQFIKIIIFPWNDESDVDWMIKTWDQFSELKTFKYDEVKLIWDGMDIDSFMKILKKLWEQKINWNVISKIDNINFELLLSRWIQSHVFCGEIKFWENDEYILGSLSRDINKLYLSKWYYQNNINCPNSLEITKWEIQYPKKAIITKMKKMVFLNDNISSF